MSTETLNLDQIQNQLKQTIQTSGGDCEQLRALGLSLQMQGYAAAERCLRLALQRNPHHALSHYTLSRQLNAASTRSCSLISTTCSPANAVTRKSASCCASPRAAFTRGWGSTRRLPNGSPKGTDFNG